MSDNLTGENSPSWKNGITPESELIRKRRDYTNWRKKVFRRDRYTCQICLDDRGGNLEAHHLNGFDTFIDQRFDIDNGITLCENCHHVFHSCYGFGANTKEQFIDWLRGSLG